MSTAEPTPTFDAAKVTAALLGDWHMPLPGPGLSHGEAWLRFFPDGRAVQISVFESQPKCPVVHRLWFTVESPTLIRFRPKQNDGGWHRDYCLEGDALTLSAEGKSFFCVRLRPEAVPEWVTDASMVEASKMVG